MPASRREKGFAHLAILELPRLVFKLAQGLALDDERKLAALGSRAGVLGNLTGHFGEVGSPAQGLIHGVDTLLGHLLLVSRSLLRQQQQDVAHLHHAAVAVDLLLGLRIDFTGLGLHIGIINHGWTNLLVSVTGKFLLERPHGVQTGSLCCLHFQLVIDKQGNVFLDRLLVDDCSCCKNIQIPNASRRGR